MRGPKPDLVVLTHSMRVVLEQLERRPSTPQQIALRARIVLAAADGRNSAQIARDLSISLDMARLWRRRWLALAPTSLEDLPVLDRLSDAPRSGKPVRITAEQVCQIIELAVKRQSVLAVQLAIGVSARLLPKSKHAASSSRLVTATPHVCSKGGTQTAPMALLADARQRRGLRYQSC